LVTLAAGHSNNWQGFYCPESNSPAGFARIAEYLVGILKSFLPDPGLDSG
jgi:hypothetical protein